MKRTSETVAEVLYREVIPTIFNQAEREGFEATLTMLWERRSYPPLTSKSPGSLAVRENPGFTCIVCAGGMDGHACPQNAPKLMPRMRA